MLKIKYCSIHLIMIFKIMITPHAIHFFHKKFIAWGVWVLGFIRKAHLRVSQNLRFQKPLPRVLRIFAHGKKKNPEGFSRSSIFLCVPIRKRLELVPACSSFCSFVLVFPNKTSKNSRLHSANETPHYKFLAFRHPSAYIRPISPSVQNQFEFCLWNWITVHADQIPFLDIILF